MTLDADSAAVGRFIAAIDRLAFATRVRIGARSGAASAVAALTLASSATGLLRVAQAFDGDFLATRY